MEANPTLGEKGAPEMKLPTPLNCHPAMALFRHPKSPLYSRNGVSADERPLLPRALRRYWTGQVVDW